MTRRRSRRSRRPRRWLGAAPALACATCFGDAEGAADRRRAARGLAAARRHARGPGRLRRVLPLPAPARPARPRPGARRRVVATAAQHDELEERWPMNDSCLPAARLAARRGARPHAGPRALADAGAVRRLGRLLRLRALPLPRASATRWPTTRACTSHASTWLEVGVAVAEAILLIGFSIPLWAERVDELPARDARRRGARGRPSSSPGTSTTPAPTASSAGPTSS